MREGSKFAKITSVLYLVTAFLVVAFLVYINFTEDISKQSTRPIWKMRVYENIQPEIERSPSSPQGVIKRFHLKVEGDGYNNAICFYAVHCNVKLYVGDDLIYRLKPKDSNKMIHTPGSVWVMVPLRLEDKGKELTVLMEPVYGDFTDTPQTFYMGPRMDLHQMLLRASIPNLFICLIAIICGLAMVGSSLVRFFRRQGDTAGGYLGLFAIMMGIWKVMDSTYAPLMFKASPLVLSTISLTMLSLAVFPLINYMRMQIRLKGFPVLEIAGAFTVGLSLACLILQVTGVLEYRQSLVLTHASVVISILAIVLACVRAWIMERENPKVRMAVLFLAFCVVGAVIDLIVFYIKGDSGSILFMVVAFLSYFLFMAAYNNKELTQKANRDLFTGLYNRSRCNELLKSKVHIRTLSAFALFDINDLKLTNDTLGHEAGDQMILGFVDILKAEAGPRSFLGRYGGDEFIMYMQDVDKDRVRRIMDRIRTGMQTHNAAGIGPHISYSAGLVFSDELVKPVLMDLFQKADERMYVEKNRYHEDKDRRKADSNGQ